MVEAITGKTITSLKTSNASDSSASIAVAQAGTASAKIAATQQPLNPRLRYDRLAGVVITEFLNQSGTVQLQTPSSAVLAYLRVGLGADGHSKYQPVEDKKDIAQREEEIKAQNEVFDS
ncbi:MAG: hypothetical protein SFW65_10160 [Alphaproteobacteria bacterium]|nr:hypothetical protein [Alphaproteobacteria bacterium]